MRSSGVRSVSPRPWEPCISSFAPFAHGAMNHPHGLLAHEPQDRRRLQALLAENRQLGRAEALQGSACARYPTPGS